MFVGGVCLLLLAQSAAKLFPSNVFTLNLPNPQQTFSANSLLTQFTLRRPEKLLFSPRMVQIAKAAVPISKTMLSQYSPLCRLAYKHTHTHQPDPAFTHTL